MIKYKILFFTFLIPLFTLSQEGENYIDYIKVYQKYLSQIRGGECQMYPSCSNYGLLAFKQYNPIKAMTITSDRVLRCSHDFNNYDITIQNDKFKLIDFPNASDNVKTKMSFRSEVTTYPTTRNDSCDLGFINNLMLEKNYREALLEINRLLYKNKTNCIELYINLIRCKRSLNEIEEVIFKYDNSFPESIKNDNSIKLEIGSCYLELLNYTKASEFYEKYFILDTTKNENIYMLQALIHSEQGDFKKSKSYFEKVQPSSPYFYNAQKSISIIESQNIIKYKNPLMAGTLAIIPGLGYLYSGHKSSAISSVIVNGLLGYALYSSIKVENYGMAALVGVFSFSFYIGNISGSIKSSKRYNEAQKRKIINQIKSNINY